MCGAGIDAQGKESSSNESAAPRRTRQNTITQPPTEFVQAIDAVKAADAEAAAAPPIEMDPEEGFDPLRDYLDDTAGDEPPVRVESKENIVEAPQSAAPAPFVKAVQQEEDDFDIFSDDDDDWLDDLEDELPIIKEEEVKETVAPEVKVVEEPAMSAKEPDMRPREQPKRHDTANQKAVTTTREQPRVVVESGARPNGKPSAFSFSKGKADEGNKRSAQEQGRGPAKSEPAAGNSFARQQNAKPKENRPPEREQQRNDRPRQEPRAHNAAQHEQRRDEPSVKQASHSQGDKHGRDRQENRAEPQQQRRNQETQEHKGRTPAYEGVESRLVGWLVSFSTPTRSSYELREGKFFVSGSSLKANDLVINDSSVATPHAIVAVESGRLHVQDLMSDSGVFRRRAREGSFAAFAEPFELKHGDWVRFGNVDFLVTMIPSEQE
jgi:hypothetical protein